MSPRRRSPAWSVGMALLALVSTTASLAALAAEIDAATSHVGFSLQTRWGQQLEGRFPSVRGMVDDLGDGRHRVRLILSTLDVEIVGHPGYTRFTRGSGFFDAAHWPQAEFLSDPYSPELLRDGGNLGGILRMRGVQHHEIFVVLPATCARPGHDCDVVASGHVQRSDYGMGRWGIAVGDDVRFSLRMRMHGDATP